MQNNPSGNWQNLLKKSFVIAISITLAAFAINVTFLLYLWLLNIPSPISFSQIPNSICIMVGGIISLVVGFISFMKFKKYFSQVVETI